MSPIVIAIIVIIVLVLIGVGIWYYVQSTQTVVPTPGSTTTMTVPTPSDNTTVSVTPADGSGPTQTATVPTPNPTTTIVVPTPAPSTVVNTSPAIIPPTPTIPPMPMPPTAPAICAGVSGTYQFIGDSVPPGTTFANCQGLKSKSGGYILVQQSDGNFVLYNMTKQVPIWASNTMRSTGLPNKTVYQTDTNVATYDTTGKLIWASGKYGMPSTVFTMQDDGNAVVYNGTSPIWATGTNGR